MKKKYFITGFIIILGILVLSRINLNNKYIIETKQWIISCFVVVVEERPYLKTSANR